MKVRSITNGVTLNSQQNTELKYFGDNVMCFRGDRNLIHSLWIIWFIANLLIFWLFQEFFKISLVFEMPKRNGDAGVEL